MNLNECIEKRFLARIKPDEKLVEKELKESSYDLGKSRKAFEEQDYKWCIVKSYYAMFHAARAVLFRMGLVEKRHFAVTVVLKHLHKEGKLESRFVNAYEAAVSSREGADYSYTYSQRIAEENLNLADEFCSRMKGLLEKIRGG